MVDILVDNPTSKKTPLLFELQEGNKLWGSEENVQFWVNNISEGEFSTLASGSSSPTKSDGDVFLQLPGDYSDDLVLGAEAKHYGHLSPRLSPLCSFDNNDKETEENICEEIGDFEEPLAFQFHPSPDHEDDLEEIDIRREESILIKLQKHSASFQESTFFVTEPQQPPSLKVSDFFSGSLDSVETFSSITSSYDRPSSLAAALRTDPEELLYNLGFCEQNSLLQTIPARFFLNESEAYGIDVGEIHISLMMDDEEKSVASAEPVTANPLLQRFSESSIDLQSVASNDSSNPLNNARTRRILFKSSHNDIPSIHLTGDEDRSLSSPTSTSSGTNWMKLETLEEVPEPTSRGSSFEMDKTPSNNYVETMQKVRTRLENVQHIDVIRRKSSDTNTSHGGTLVDEDDRMSYILNSSLDDIHSLNMPTFYMRCNSDKSVSSVNTVIEQRDYNNGTNKREIIDQTNSTTASEFKPIHGIHDNQDEPRKEYLNINEETYNGRISPTLTASSRRSLFSNSRRMRATLANDNVFISSESGGTSIERRFGSKEIDIACLRTPGTPKTLNEIRRASPNTSFREFIKQLAAETAPPPVNSISLPDEDTLLNSPSHNAMVVTLPEPIQAPVNICTEINAERNHDSEMLNVNETNTNTKPTPTKKGYLSAAIDSLSSVFTKYNDSKQSKCADNIDGDSASSSATEKKNTSPLFKLFSHHQTLPVHTNSAFSTVAVSLATGEVDLDSISEQEQMLSRRQSGGSPVKSTSANDLLAISDARNERNSSFECAADSPLSSDDIHCKCPSPSVTVSNKQKRLSRLTSNRRSCESSGFSDDQQREIKCPLGKNCSLIHLNGKHVYPSSSSIESNRLTVKSNETSSKKTSFDKTSNSSVIQRQPLTHDHFDYMVQQIVAIRGEIKEEFEHISSRENKLKKYIADQMNEIKKVVSSDYIGRIVREMQQLKATLQEKDDEIRRLREVIVKTNSQHVALPCSSGSGTEA